MINEDLLNADGLDLTTLKMTGDKFYNGEPYSAYRYYPRDSKYSNNDGATSGGKFKIDPELIKAGIGVATTFASGIAQNRAGQVCKRPLLPESFINRGKWSSYKQCLAREQEKVERAERERRETEERLRREAEERLRREANKGGGDGGFVPDDDKILGMPKGLAIGLGVLLGVAVLGGGAYLILRKK
jgi:hypothetical protein